MELKEQSIEIKLEDAIITLQECSIDDFFELETYRTKGDVAQMLSFIKERVTAISNLKYKGEFLTLEQFKNLKVPTSFAFALIRLYCTRVMQMAIGEIKQDQEQETKNEESQIDLSGHSISLN